MIELTKFKVIIITTLISVMLINFLLKRVIIAVIPNEPIDHWGWGLMGALAACIVYVFDFKLTGYDWLWFALFIFFFSLFLSDFDDFYFITMDAFQSRV